jgi:hypothetical protein
LGLSLSSLSVLESLMFDVVAKKNIFALCVFLKRVRMSVMKKRMSSIFVLGFFGLFPRRLIMSNFS